MRAISNPPLVLSALLLPLLLASGAARAHPERGVPCSPCHTPSTGKVTISGNDTTAALIRRLDGKTSEALKVFTVRPGETVNLTIDVTNGDFFYDPVVFNLNAGGVENNSSNKLKLPSSIDPMWTGDFSDQPKPYFAFAPDGIQWSGSTTTYTYHLAVLPGTPVDYYSVFLGATGALATLQTWKQFEEIYVHVVSIPEPATIWLLGFAVGVLGFVARGRSSPH